MHVREATPDDRERIVDELLIPSFKEDEAIDPSFNELAEDALTGADCDYWLDADNRILFVAVEDEQFIGHISGNEVDEPPIYARDSRVHIDGLYVKQQHRRSGVASRLLERIEAWARERGCEYLGVAAHKDNDGARQLYETEFNLKFLSYRRAIR
jgi:GNAT superfamily N-acetyltransferase